MKLRILLLGIAMGLLCGKIHAGIVITTSDQQTVEALVTDVTSLSWEGDFKDGNLIVNYTDGTIRQIAISSVEGVSFTEDAPNAISLTKTDSEGVIVYDVQGRLIQQGIIADVLNSLPKGIYIIKGKNVTIKYLKK